MTASYSFNSNHFLLKARAYNKKTKIKMQMVSPILTTTTIPDVIGFLEQNLPSVLRNKCFNDKKLPFHKEVTRTEIGHLFEHVLLEYLCLEKRLLGYKKVCFSGVTQWNWEVDKRGVFHITVNAGFSEKEILGKAMNKGINLMNDLLDKWLAKNILINSAGNLSLDHPLQTEALS
jgi:hypothetical protein